MNIKKFKKLLKEKSVITTSRFTKILVIGLLLLPTIGCSGAGVTSNDMTPGTDVSPVDPVDPAEGYYTDRSWALLWTNEDDLTNSGTINVLEKDMIGILADYGSRAINLESGVINLIGEHSIGMLAQRESTIINHGTINVGNIAGYAMKAIHSEIYNTVSGIIYIDASHPDPEGADILLMFESDLHNVGTIEVVYNPIKSSSEPLSIKTDNLSSYVVGTSEDGTYGTIKANSVSIDGNIKVDPTLAKGDFQDKYLLSNIIESTNITMGPNYNITSGSLLYDAHSSLNISGGLDATLTRNNSTLSTYAKKDYVSIANIFDKYIDKKAILTLDTDQKNIINKIFENTKSNQNINKTLNDLSGNIYSNIPRQIFETNDLFTNKEVELIENLGEEKVNFSVLGDITKNTSKYDIEGYKSEMTGFIGVAKLSENLFGTFGYGYNKINYDYSGNGNLQSIHAGLYKYYDINEMNFKIGLNGEYNFHKTERDIYSLDKKANSDFNSYTINLKSELSKTFGSSLYIQPTIGLDAGYSSQESFTETGAGAINLNVGKEDYTSIKPSIGLEVGKKFDNITFYASSKYFYELGNIDKNRQMSFENFNGEFQALGDHLKGSSTELKIGTSINYKNIGFNINLGKTFGKRDKEFINAGFSYKF